MEQILPDPIDSSGLDLTEIDGLDELETGPELSPAPEVEKSSRDVCVVMTGSVDAGKSTLIGVLFSGQLDDGRGSARKLVSKHPHELEEGNAKTSDVSTRIMHFKDGRKMVLVDLCGHQKYLKTTIHGITGYFPDYGVVIINASKGLLRMTKEHIALLSYLEIPMIFVITKVDITPEDKYERTRTQIDKFLRHPQIGKTPEFVNDLPQIKRRLELQAKMVSGITEEEMAERITLEGVIEARVEELIGRLAKSSTWSPIITVSNKRGDYIEEVKTLMNGLLPRPRTLETPKYGNIFYIDSSFTPPGIGLVISGTVFGETIKVGDQMYLGPFMKQYYPVKVRSIHDNDKQDVPQLEDGEKGCLAVRVMNSKVDIGRNDIKKGMVAVKNELLLENTCLEFEGEIDVWHHQTQIGPRFTPKIHCGPTAQTARIILPRKVDEEGKEIQTPLKTGDRERVRFRFISHPEFMEVGMRFVFREGRTTGCGMVTAFKPLSEDPDPPAQERRRARYRGYRKKGKGKISGKGKPKRITRI